jgi:hypothetical protein
LRGVSSAGAEEDSNLALALASFPFRWDLPLAFATTVVAVAIAFGIFIDPAAPGSLAVGSPAFAVPPPPARGGAFTSRNNVVMFASLAPKWFPT